MDDLSRYDTDQDVLTSPNGVILNVEDPSLVNKARIALDAGIHVLLYSWVYPGQGAGTVQRSLAAASALEAWGVHVVAHAWDYEQDGVTPQDLRDAFDAAQAAGIADEELGYTYLFILNDELRAAFNASGVPLWIAFYPGSNDGSYPEWAEQEARATGAVLWQFSSSNGTRDRSAILDDAWWERITGSKPKPTKPQEPDAMNILTVTNAAGKSLVFTTDAAGGLYVRAFDQGKPLNSAKLSDQANPNADIVIGAFDIGYVAATDGRLLQISPTAYGPAVTVV